MRRLAHVVAPLLLVIGAGCRGLQEMGGAEDAGAQIPVRTENETPAHFVRYLNSQSLPVRSLHLNYAELEVSGNGESFSANSVSIVCEKPRSFHMVAGRKMVLRNAVQIGSNPSEFWVHSQFLRPDPFVYCSHDDFQAGKARLPFPFDPDWVLQVLNMSRYDPALAYTLDHDKAAGEYRLAYDAATPDGKPVRRVVVFAQFNAPGNKPQIRRHLIQDAAGATIASATVTEVNRKNLGRAAGATADTVVAIPSKITLDWPQQKCQLKLTLPEVMVNSPISPADRQALFTRPELPGVQAKNLAAGAGVERGAAPRSGLPPR